MTRQNRRLIPIAGAVLALALSAACSQRTAAERGRGSTAPTAASVALSTEMRKLWTDHVVWTRDYIVASLAGQPGAKSAADRLMKNQEDIGAAVGEYYGREAGNQLTSLLKEHITGAVAVVDAAKSGDKTALQRADESWRDNARRIAEFLAAANPNWPKDSVLDLLNGHLTMLTEDVTARLKQDWDGDIRASDKNYEHVMKLADALSDGIVKQFPNRFGMEAAPAK